ncbi:hypothetical protein R6Q59_008813 [Mikania micrantha]
MKKPFLLLVLVVASLPALQGYRRTLQATAPAPSPDMPTAPGPAPVPVPFPPQLPPPSGGGGGIVMPQDGGRGSSGLSGGQKAGIAIGVLAGAGLIGFATMVYMKRRSNIQRARFGVLARRSQL